MESLLKKEIKIFPKWIKHKTVDHLICVLLFIIVYIQYFKYSNNQIDNLKDKILNSYWAFNKFLIIFLIYILPTPYIKRPFRFLWKLCQSASLVYLINILFLCFLDKKTIWIIFNYLDNNLPGPIVEKSYAVDCRLYTPENKISKFFNLYECFDVYVLCHLVGWFSKGFIFRNNYIIWFCSIGFEFLEKTFQYYFSNFRECWWDSLILDVFGMNLLGIILSNYFINKFNVKKYYWISEPLINKSKNLTKFQKIKFFFNSINYYNSINKFHIFGNLKNFLTVLYIIILNFLVDMSNFFNKYVLRLPSNHFFLKYRIFILTFSAIILYSDIYAHSHGNNINKTLTVPIYLANAIIVLEYILFFNNVDFNEFKNSIPFYIKFIWLIIWMIILILGYFSYKNGKLNSKGILKLN